NLAHPARTEEVLDLVGAEAGARLQRQGRDYRPVELVGATSSGSSFTIDAAWVLPTQKVTGVGLLSTPTRRTLVWPGLKDSVNDRVLGLSRTMRSLYSPPDHTSPFLSIVTS